MFRYEWYKIWRNPKLLAVFALFLIFHCCYFVYCEEKEEIPAHAYRNLSEELTNKSVDDAISYLEQEKQKVDSILFFDDTTDTENRKYPRFCGSLWSERALYDVMLAEYGDIQGYPAYLKKVIGAADEYHVMQVLLGGSAQEYKNVEKTSNDYRKLSGLEVRHTKTKGISTALNYPSLLLLESLFAILIATVLFTREKEQGLFLFYSTMQKGRGRLFLAKLTVIGLSICLYNFIMLLVTLLTGCFLFGFPDADFALQPLQALVGYKASSLPINILSFIVLVYMGSLLISGFVSLLTVFLSVFLPDSIRVYLALFLLMGAEGLLFYIIKDISYLHLVKRMNLVAFANVAELLGRYRNIILFGEPISYWVAALVILLVLAAVMGLYSFFRCEKGIFSQQRRSSIRKRGMHILSKGERHLNIFRHELFKYYRVERVGIIILIMLVYVLAFTKPMHESFSNMVEMHYKAYYMRLEKVSPQEYQKQICVFEDEIAEARRKNVDESAIAEKEEALQMISDYVSYLETKDGSHAVYQKEYELLYNVRARNIAMGVLTLLLTILCSASMGYIEYRTGMGQMIRISYAGRYKVVLLKVFILCMTLVAVFGMVYVRYVYQVLAGYGTDGIISQANSMMNWSSVMPTWSIRDYLVWIYARRFIGMLIAAFVTWAMMRKLKSYILTVFASVFIMVLPLLLCLSKANVIDYLALNYFFL